MTAPDADDQVVVADGVDRSGAVEALGELRRSRRRHRVGGVHWIDALYQAYLAALVGGGAVVVAIGSLPDEPLGPDGVDAVAARGPAVVGLVATLVVVAGLRSGRRGGPLTLEAATVAHELSAPLPRRLVLRRPALQQLRFLAFVGTVVGAAAGLVASHRFPHHAGGWMAAGAATGALVLATAHGVALVVAGRRPPRPLVGLVGIGLVVWAVLDVVAGTATSPLGPVGRLALWPLSVEPVAAVALLLAVGAVAVGLASLEGLSIEAARRRAGLVSQLRFAATLQDVRTVVLLRRQLAQERARSRPWVRIGGERWLPPAWQRDLRGLARHPGARLLRMVALAVVAGLAVGLAWRGTSVALVAAGTALYLAAYDAVEPIAQEVDHPTRWDALPGDPGRLLLQHVPVAMATMAVLTLVAAAASLVLVPADVVGAVLPVALLPVAAATTMAAAVSTGLGPANMASLSTMGAEVMGLVMVARSILPLALAVTPLLALLTVGHDPLALDLGRLANIETWPLIVCILAGTWLRNRRPSTT